MTHTNAAGANALVFRAYPSRMQALVALAAFLPFVATGLVALPFGSGVPLWLRIVGLIILAPIFGMMLGWIRHLIVTGPIIDISEQGFIWRGWSEQVIPWTAISRWESRNYLGSQQATFWLDDPSAYPSSTINGLINPANKLLGFGDVTFNTGGTNRDFAELIVALRHFAQDPRTRR